METGSKREILRIPGQRLGKVIIHHGEEQVGVVQRRCGIRVVVHTRRVFMICDKDRQLVLHTDTGRQNARTSVSTVRERTRSWVSTALVVLKDVLKSRRTPCSIRCSYPKKRFLLLLVILVRKKYFALMATQIMGAVIRRLPAPTPRLHF